MGAFAKSNPILGPIESEYESNMRAADQAENDARYNAELRKQEGVKLRKEQQAAYSASGVELEGTPANVIKEDEANAHIEAMNMIYAGQFKKTMMRNQARLARYNGYLSLVKDGAKAMAQGGGA